MSFRNRAPPEMILGYGTRYADYSQSEAAMDDLITSLSSLSTASPGSVFLPHLGQGGAANDGVPFAFGPERIALGSLTGSHFTPMVDARCEGAPYRGKNTDPSLVFDFKYEKISVRSHLSGSFPLALSPLDIDISFLDISSHGIHVNIIGVDPSGLALVDVTICCRRPPRYYAPFRHELTPIQRHRSQRMPFRRRATAVDFANPRGPAERNAGIVEAIPHGDLAKPTAWNAFRFSFRFDMSQLNLFNACAQKLRMLSRDDPELALMAPDNSRPLVQIRKDTAWLPPDLSAADFGTRVLVEGLIAHAILRPVDTPALLLALKQHAVVHSFRQRILESLFTEERIREPAYAVSGRARHLRRVPLVKPVPHQLLIRTVIVTPTRVLVGPPMPEPGNSVTRRYESQLDAIIRVQFRDEGENIFVNDHMRKADDVRSDLGLLARVRRTLQHGLLVGGRQYYPVASSSSQQKDHSMWFFDNRAIDLSELRQWMGSVKEKIVAKHAARMGLPFSATRAVDFGFRLSKTLEDVKRNGYVFTDGCAVAGLEVMRQAALVLGAKPDELVPSAIQFRLGGAKGVLAYWPSVQADEIMLRKSQIKFESNLQQLNVVRSAKYQPGFLNRQFIVIMAANNVPSKVFESLFRAQVVEIQNLPKRVKAQQLTSSDIGLMRSQTGVPLVQLIKSGFQDNPFVRDMCRLLECRVLQDLKWRARIRVPNSVFLIGISDETGTLEEGEIFCQYQKSNDNDSHIVTGQVVVCRAPALHPGDVRHATAVYNHRLAHLKNVVVFSVKGDRPLPNMLGGGDLDGDDFTVIWDPRFVHPLIESEPMDYTPPEPVSVPEVTQTHLNENFVHYITNDVLGQVDNSHLALSDSQSPSSPKCLQLAETHSLAVDFAKTGVPARMTDALLPKMYPDFMGKDPDRTYPSEKTLGLLFRIVDPEPKYRPLNLEELYDAFPYPFTLDPRIVRPLLWAKSDMLIDVLWDIKFHYENRIVYAMRRYGVHEAELVMGAAVRTKQRKTNREQRHLNEPLQETYKQQVVGIRDWAEEYSRTHVRQSYHGLSGMQVLAYHAYILTFDRQYVERWERDVAHRIMGSDFAYERIDDERLKREPLLSFAFVFAKELIEISQIPLQRGVYTPPL